MTGHQKVRRLTSWSRRGAGKLNEASAISILEAVGKELVRPDIDKAAMIRGINLCFQWYQSARDYTTDKGRKDRSRRLEVIYNKVRALDILLANDDSWLPLGAPPSYGSLFHDRVKRLVEVVDHAIKVQERPDGGAKAYRDSFKVRSPFEWLVAYFLPDVFFLLRIAQINNLKELTSRKSPYVRFVQAILAELGIGLDGRPYKPATIVKALRDSINNRGRRKGNATGDPYAYWRESLMRKEMSLPPPPMPKEPQPGFYLVSSAPNADVAVGQN